MDNATVIAICTAVAAVIRFFEIRRMKRYRNKP